MLNNQTRDLSLRANWTHLFIVFALLSILSFSFGACRKSSSGESGETGGRATGSSGSERYRFEVRTFHPVDPTMKPVKQVFFASNKTPIAVSWEGAPETSYNDNSAKNLMAIPIGPRPDGRPWTFTVNTVRFSLSPDSLEGAGQNWSLKDGEKVEINLDGLQ